MRKENGGGVGGEPFLRKRESIAVSLWFKLGHFELDICCSVSFGASTIHEATSKKRKVAFLVLIPMKNASLWETVCAERSMQIHRLFFGHQEECNQEISDVLRVKLSFIISAVCLLTAPSFVREKYSTPQLVAVMLHFCRSCCHFQDTRKLLLAPMSEMWKLPANYLLHTSRRGKVKRANQKTNWMKQFLKACAFLSFRQNARRQCRTKQTNHRVFVVLTWINCSSRTNKTITYWDKETPFSLPMVCSWCMTQSSHGTSRKFNTPSIAFFGCSTKPS